ncbi:MAG TPA: hypothetical protein DEH78_11480 [Solibacterales bacterium]|nr:hypothetical protein [Bryobacterales bacterium]
MGGAANWFTSEWAERLRQSIEAMTGESPVVEPVPVPAGREENCLWWVQPLSAGTGAALAVGATAAAWREIGGRTLRAAGIDQADDADLEGTYREVLSQALSGLCQGLGKRLGREVTCGPGATAPQAPELERTAFQIVFGGGQPALMYAAPNSALLGALDSQSAGGAHTETAVARQEAAAVPGVASRNLDLLLEVELPVSVSFGRAQLRLRDAIKLTTGSIVELNRSILEPVEVIVNNCVIARGEVVVIEGYYGVRIQQIVSKQERLRTLA